MGPFFSLSLVYKFLLVLLYHSYIIRKKKIFFNTKFILKPLCFTSTLNPAHLKIKQPREMWLWLFILPPIKTGQTNPPRRMPQQGDTPPRSQSQLKLSQLRVQVSRLVNERLMSWRDRSENYCFNFFIGYSHNSGTK